MLEKIKLIIVSILYLFISLFVITSIGLLCFLTLSKVAFLLQEDKYEFTSETIIVDKFISFSKSGTPLYYLVYKDDNGTILQENVNPDVYYRFEIDVIE